MKKLNVNSKSYIRRVELSLHKLTTLNDEGKLCKRELLNQIEIAERNLANLKWETREFTDVPRKYRGYYDKQDV